jgi:hypothetical protein
MPPNVLHADLMKSKRSYRLFRHQQVQHRQRHVTAVAEEFDDAGLAL